MSWIEAYCLSLAAKAILEAAGVLPGGATTITTSPTSTAIVATTSSSPAPSSTSSSSAGSGSGSGSIQRNFRLQVQSSDTTLNNNPISASSSYTFAIGGTTSSTCTGTSDCNSFPNTTTVTIANGYGDMYNGVDKTQALFIDPSTGALGYQSTSGTGSGAISNGALMTGLVVRNGDNGNLKIVYNDGQDRDWIACGTEYVAASIVGQCKDGSFGEKITLEAIPVDDPGAWSYGPA